MKTTKKQTLRSPHRLRSARLREGMSLRSVARRMNCPVSKVREQESGKSELSVSDLYRWQQALNVPLAELLEVPDASLDEPVRQRACLVRVAKTAHFLVKKCEDGPEQRLARQLVDQLYELMPELKEINAWPERRPRPVADFGRAADEISTTEWMLPPAE